MLKTRELEQETEFMTFDNRKSQPRFENDDRQANLLFELITILNSNDITPDKIYKYKVIAANIDNNKAKKDLLINKLSCENFIPKIIAIEILAPSLISDSTVRSLLINTLEKNENELIRKAILTVFSPFADIYKEIGRSLIKILMDKYESSTTKEQIIKILTHKLGDQSLREMLMLILHNESSNVKITAINALSNYTDDKKVLSYLLKCINEPDVLIKIAAIKALKHKCQEYEIKNILISRLKEQDEYQAVKEAIIETLSAYLKQQNDIQRCFMDVFFNEKNAEVRNLIKNLLLTNISTTKLEKLFSIKIQLEKITPKINSSDNLVKIR